jgi:spore coat protein U-like protein
LLGFFTFFGALLMSKHCAILKAIPAAILLCASGFAAASDAQNLVVTANVQPICKFVSVPALTFSIDPSAAGSQAGTVAVTYKCTKDQAPTIGVASGALTGRTLTRALGGTMAYALSLGALTASTGFSAANSVDVTATVLQAAYQDAVAGAYTETVSLTINP